MIRFGITTEILSHCLSYLPPKNIHCHYTYITLIWRLPNTTLDRDLGSQLQVGGSNDLKRAAFLESSLDYSQLKTKVWKRRPIREVTILCCHWRPRHSAWKTDVSDHSARRPCLVPNTVTQTQLRKKTNGIIAISTLPMTSPVPGKPAVPRHARTAIRNSRRVARACESCRKRKTKCSGDRPTCRQCRLLQATTCLYSMEWRERTKR